MNKQKQLKELQKIPWVGVKTANYLWEIGIRSIKDLKNKDPEELYLKISAKKGYSVDRCLLYVCRMVVYYASHKKHDPDKLKWWYWKDE